MRSPDGNDFKVRQLPGGAINQAGVPMSSGVSWDNTRGFSTKAVVLKTYYADDPEWESRAWASGTMRGVCCDVRTYGRYSRLLYRVPVLQRAHGVHDEDIYIPRDTSQNMEPGGSLVASGDGTPTAAENMDGDHVLVGFLEGNPDNPVIYPYCIPHPNSARKLTSDAGRVKRFRHAGVEIEWSEDGNLTIDATGAAKEKLGTAGAEQSNSGTGGQIIIKTSDGTNETSIHLDANGAIRIGSDTGAPSDEPMVLGNLWISVMEELIDAISAITVGTGVGPSTTPINFAQLAAIKAKISAKQHVSDFIFGKKDH